MSTQVTGQRMHPMLWIAAISVTAASLLGIASMTGLFPASAPATASEKAAPESAPPTAAVIAPAEPAAPGSESQQPLAETVAAVEPQAAAVPAKKPIAEKVTAPAPSKQAQQPRPAATTVRSEPAPARVGYDEPLSPPLPAAQCLDCGHVEAIRPIQARGEGSGIGAIAGGVLGGVIGNQMGKGTGKDLATIGGAVLGGIAGHQVEKNTLTVTRYDISVRMDNGEHRVVTVKDAPMWREGDRVAIRDGQLVAPQADQPAPYSSSGAARF